MKGVLPLRPLELVENAIPGVSTASTRGTSRWLSPHCPQPSGASLHLVALDGALEPPVLDTAHVAGIPRRLASFEHFAPFGLVCFL